MGFKGEQQAVRYLLSLNYTIICTNFLSPSGEIDIVTLDVRENEIVFCEVKTRSSEKFGHPYRAINWKKKRAQQRCAIHFLKTSRIFQPFRFDLITIVQNKLSHYRNITL